MWGQKVMEQCSVIANAELYAETAHKDFVLTVMHASYTTENNTCNTMSCQNTFEARTP